MSENTFREQLRADAESRLAQRDAAWHASIAEQYAREAAAQMGSQIDRGGGTANPPHALRFAELHAQLAIVRSQIPIEP